jgi:hypothetical protein
MERMNPHGKVDPGFLTCGKALPLFDQVIREMWNSSTFSGTVPQKVELLHFVSVFLDTARSSYE